MHLLTAAEMRAVDQATVAAGTPVATLMERAGRGVAATLERVHGSPLAMHVTVFAGGGHNGGDGLVAARALAERGAHVTVIVCATRLAAATQDALARLEGTRVRVQHAADDAAFDACMASPAPCDVALDALLGTGAEGAPRGTVARACAQLAVLRARGVRIVTVDLPTGVASDDGSVSSGAVQADLTVTFGAPRRGHWLWPGRAHRGRLEVIDIGLVSAADAGLAPVELATLDALATLVPVRDPRSHKTRNGRALLVGGAPGMTGALVLAAQGALRSGAGYVRVAAPASLLDTLAAHLVEAMPVGCGEDDQRTLTSSALPRLLDEAARADAVAVGNGMSTRPRAAAIVRELATHLDRPLVLDADALTALAPAAEQLVPALRLAPAPRILTPHLGEMSRLTGQTPEELEARRIDTAHGWAMRWGVTLVLKGAPTVVAAADGRVSVNPTGSAVLATAGTGDVLTGAIVSLLAQGLPPYDAARLAVYAHGLAGELAESRIGALGVTASDVAASLPAAFTRITNRS